MSLDGNQLFGARGHAAIDQDAIAGEDAQAVALRQSDDAHALFLSPHADGRGAFRQVFADALDVGRVGGRQEGDVVGVLVFVDIRDEVLRGRTCSRISLVSHVEVQIGARSGSHARHLHRSEGSSDASALLKLVGEHHHLGLAAHRLHDAGMRIDADVDDSVVAELARRVVDELDDERVLTVLDALADESALQLFVAHIGGGRHLHLTAVAHGPALGMMADAEEVVVFNGGGGGEVAVEVVVDGISHHERLFVAGGYVGVGNLELLVVDGGHHLCDGRCAGVADVEAHGERAAAEQCLAGVAHAVLEVVAEVFLVLHDHGRAVVLEVGQRIDHFDARVVEEAVEVHHRQAFELAADGERIGDMRCGLQRDARCIEHHSLLLVVDFCAVATHGVAHLGPEDGEVVLLVGRAVADDFHEVGRAVVGTDVVACQAVACAVHAQGLHIDVARRIVLLIEHGDDGMLTDAVHEESLRIDGVVDEGDLVAAALDGSELELAVVASRVEGVASHADAHEHGVVAHHQVVVGGAGVFVEMHEVDGR